MCASSVSTPSATTMVSTMFTAAEPIEPALRRRPPCANPSTNLVSRTRSASRTADALGDQTRVGDEWIGLRCVSSKARSASRSRTSTTSEPSARPRSRASSSIASARKRLRTAPSLGRPQSGDVLAERLVSTRTARTPLVLPLAEGAEREVEDLRRMPVVDRAPAAAATVCEPKLIDDRGIRAVRSLQVRPVRAGGSLIAPAAIRERSCARRRTRRRPDAERSADSARRPRRRAPGRPPVRPSACRGATSRTRRRRC